LVFGPAVFGRHVLALDEASVLKDLAESAQVVREPVRRLGVEEADHGHRTLLRARRARPKHRRRGDAAAEERDEFAASEAPRRRRLRFRVTPSIVIIREGG
jgi:hypothetical protein